MAQRKVNVCDLVVAHELCVGCGVCGGLCPTHNLPMSLTQQGEYIPIDQGRCLDKCKVCLDACPFFDHSVNEDTIADNQFGQGARMAVNPFVGHYSGVHVGHAVEGDYRANGASGGMATWFLSRLLTRGVVDKVICVSPGINDGKLFSFAVVDNVEDLKRSARSAYYPVEMSGVIRTIMSEEARYAVIGLPCFLKGLRIAMGKNTRLRDRLVVLAGLTCGQTKSSGYSDYLVRRCALSSDSIKAVSFRDKDAGKPATELVFRAEGNHTTRRLYWSEYGDVWTSGQFKVRACDFCDDTFAEVADVVFMDAWLPDYRDDGLGSSIVVTRSELAEQFLREGNSVGAVALQPLPIEAVVASQAGVVHQKRTTLSYRLWLADQRGEHRPKKRVKPTKPGIFDRVTIHLQESLRKASHAGMVQQRQTGEGLAVYHDAIAVPLRRLIFIRRLRYAIQRVHGALRRLFRRFRGRDNQ